jgi:mannan endo-1,4-beta-mannosidase
MRFSVVQLLLLSSSVSAAALAKEAPKGFVTREGQVFKLDGKNFYFAGSNAYYFPFNDVRSSRERQSPSPLTLFSSHPTLKRVSLPRRKPD